MKIYTRTGDKGSTSLFGGDRVSKSSVRLHAYGTLDELNAELGVIVSHPELPTELKTQLQEIQILLFSLGADLATPIKSKATIVRVSADHALRMEGWIDAMEESLTPLTLFILPGGTQVGALLHVARTVCRRAERWIVELKKTEPINDDVITIVNRLSDYLFVAARYANLCLNAKETPVTIPRAEKVS
jgi:cob(I)alamin adenosyltransferase